jgi:hypothetical protein
MIMLTLAMTHDENKVKKPRKAVGYSGRIVLLIATLWCAYNEDNNLY